MVVRKLWWVEWGGTVMLASGFILVISNLPFLSATYYEHHLDIESLLVGTDALYKCNGQSCEICQRENECPLTETYMDRCDEIPICPANNTFKSLEECLYKCPEVYFCNWQWGECKTCQNQECGVDRKYIFATEEQCLFHCPVDNVQLFSCYTDTCAPCQVPGNCPLENSEFNFLCPNISLCVPHERYMSREDCESNCPPTFWQCNPPDGCSQCTTDCNPELDSYRTQDECERNCTSEEVLQDVCGENQVYFNCSQCIPTCNPFEFELCDGQCHKGCHCDHGFVMHEESCILPSECPECGNSSFWSKRPITTQTCKEPDPQTLDSESVAERKPGCQCYEDLLQLDDKNCVMESMCPHPIVYFCDQGTCIRCALTPDNEENPENPDSPCKNKKNTLYQTREMCESSCNIQETLPKSFLDKG